MVARARQPRTVHCAEYPQAIIWISSATANPSALFFLEARIVAGDALCEHKIPISQFEHVQRHFLSRVLKERASGIFAVIGYRNLGRCATCARVLCRRRPAAVSTEELSNTSRPGRARRRDGASCPPSSRGDQKTEGSGDEQDVAGNGSEGRTRNSRRCRRSRAALVLI
jgi:hypothetical protein